MNQESNISRIYTRNDWTALIAAMQSGKRIEIDAYVFNHFLEVLPPIYMNKTVKTVSGQWVRADFGYAEGMETITAFWSSGGRYFAEKTETMNPRG